MQDDYALRSRTTPQHTGFSSRAVLGTSMLAFIGGALLVGWMVWNGRIDLALGTGQRQPLIAAAPAMPDGASPAAAAAAIAQTGALDQRIAVMEQRLARLDLQAAATEGNTSRAEALLVALAARRAIERGMPLGYLENQLKLRFADAQPNAVKAVIAAARKPVTLDQLAAQLDALEPDLIDAPADEGGWQAFTREVSNLFIIRHGSAPSSQPAARLDRARLLLRGGQFEPAAVEVEHLPGSAAATAWLGAVRQHKAALDGLDLIETTALLDPTQLKTGEGKPVIQASPLAPGETAGAQAQPARPTISLD